MIEANELTKMKHDLKCILVSKLKEFVKDNGSDITQYDRHVFGLDEDEHDGVTLTKVLNFFDNDGCYFPTTRNVLTDVEPYDKSVDELMEELSDNFMYWAFHCLYIEIDDGMPVKENLKYYAFYNDGTWFSDGLSESEHDYVNNLPLEVICKIIDVIDYKYYEDKRIDSKKI